MNCLKPAERRRREAAILKSGASLIASGKRATVPPIVLATGLSHAAVTKLLRSLRRRGLWPHDAPFGRAAAPTRDRPAITEAEHRAGCEARLRKIQDTKEKAHREWLASVANAAPIAVHRDLYLPMGSADR